MQNWYLTSVRYEKTTESGVNKKVNEFYLVDAISVAEAEGRITEEMKPYIISDFEVSSIKKERVSEMFMNESGDKWYLAKVMFVTLDEHTGCEKKKSVKMYILAEDFEDAVKVLNEGMKGTMSDWEINTISETLILDVFRAELKTKAEQEISFEESKDE